MGFPRVSFPAGTLTKRFSPALSPDEEGTQIEVGVMWGSCNLISIVVSYTYTECNIYTE